MGKPIKETPVLKGKDAVKFLENLNSKKVAIDPKEKERMKANYLKIKAIAEC